MSNSSPAVWQRTAIALSMATIALIGWQLTATDIFRQLFPEAGDLSRYLTVKGLYAGFIIAIIGGFGLFAATGFRGPVKPMSVLAGLPLIVLPVLTLMQVINDSPPSFSMVMVGWILVALFVGVGEESVFRGLVYRAVEKTGLWPTALITSGLFGGAHLLGLVSDTPDSIILAQAVFAASVGLVLFAVRYVAGSIWTVVALHTFFDAIAFIAAGDIANVLPSPEQAVPRLLAGSAIMLVWGVPALLVIQWRQGRNRSDRSNAVPAAASEPA